MRASNRAKLTVRASPALWSAYVGLAFPPQRWKSARDAVCLPQHDLVLDGYPRSANSYVYNFVARFLDGQRVVHHTHASATLEMARRFDVPTFVLVRDPVDAVTSNVIRSGGNVDYHEAHYEQYHRSVLDDGDHVTVVPFETATQDPVRVLTLIERELGLPTSDPTPEDVAEAEAAIEAHLEHVAEDKYGDDAEDKKAVPDADRDETKARVREQVASRRAAPELRSLYEQLLAATPLAPRARA